MRKGSSQSRSLNKSTSSSKKKHKKEDKPKLTTKRNENLHPNLQQFEGKKKEGLLVKKKIQDLKTPELIIKANYKNKKLSIPISIADEKGIEEIMTPHIIRFQKEILKNMNFNPKSIECWRTTGPENVLKDHYFQTGKSLKVFKGEIIEIEPVWKRELSSPITLKEFQIIRCIGVGGFSRVFLVRFLPTGKFYALKLMDKENLIETGKQCIVGNEREIMVDLDNPYILKLEFAFETKNFVALGLEYCPGGELFHYLRKVKRLTEDEARYCFIEVLLGLQYLHSKKIIYRDFKPENIMIDQNGSLKIADFGLSKMGLEKNQLTSTFCGSPQYMAPEMLSRDGHSFPIDYYCVGALLYELVTGSPPFYCTDFEKITHSIQFQEVDFPPFVELSPQIKDMLSSLLVKDPKRRLGSMGGIKQILGHPWARKMKSADVSNKNIQTPIKIDLMTFNVNEEEIPDLHDAFMLKLQTEDDDFDPIFHDFYFSQAERANPEILKELNGSIKETQIEINKPGVKPSREKSRQKKQGYKSHNRENPIFPIKIKNREEDLRGLSEVRSNQRNLQQNGSRKKLDLVVKGRKRNTVSINKAEKREKNKSKEKLGSPKNAKAALKRIKSSTALQHKGLEKQKHF